MVKHLTLLLFLATCISFSFSKSGFQFTEISPDIFNNQSAKINTAGFRYDDIDYLVIQPKNNSISYFKENNIDVQMYLGDGYYLIATKTADTKSILQNIRANKTGYISPNGKIYENLKTISGSIPVTVLYSSSLNENILNKICSDAGLEIIHNDKKNYHFTANATIQQMEQLAKYPFIFYITKFYENKNPLIYESQIMMDVKSVQEVQPYGYNLKGEGVNVGIWDQGAMGTHFDLPINKNFVIDKKYSRPGDLSHPTGVAGCLGASGTFSSTGRAIASACHMYYWDIFNDVVQEIADAKSNYLIDVTNHSYNFGTTTCFESGLYIPESADLDKVVYNNPSLLPVVAVGNSASICSITDTFSSVDIGFQGCKNSLTVGWIFSNKTIVGNSGRGPTTDGRLKPELVAKGFAVGTTLPNNSFGNVNGSSYAAPQVAAIAVLLHQKYKEQFSNNVPNGSLIKSILCNTARDLGNPGPDYTYGFGLPDAYKAVYTIANNLFYEGDATQNSFDTHTIVVPSNISKLSITLCWTDKEGSPVADKIIVNDLDLKVVTPAGDTVLPWKLNPDNYKHVALHGVDKLNTIEQVTIDNASQGTYTIVVKGSAVPFGPQKFSVAYNAQERKIELVHPNGGEIIGGNGANNIRWYANGIDTLANIELSSDSGATWQTVATNYQLSKEVFPWTVPAIVSSKCLIRIKSGSNTVVSASTFTISTQINYSLINHSICDKSVKINWPAVTGATAYKIYLFIDSVWTLAGQTSLLTYTISNLTNGKSYLYAISSINNGVESNHSLANVFMPRSTSTGCTTTADVGVYAISKPLGGRKLTSSALTSTENVSLIIKNYGTVSQTNFFVYYKINNGPLRINIMHDVLTPGDTALMKYAVNEDLSAVGTYNIFAWTDLVGETNRSNDTLRTIIKNLANPPLILPFTENFETLNAQVSSSTFGLNGLDYADYYPEDGGRLRSNEGNLYANSGYKAVALDNYLGSTLKRNELIFTYNLSNYKDSLVFLDFSYLSRGESDARDTLFARGSDIKPWIPIYDLYANKGPAGEYKNVKEINLYQKLKVDTAQDFTSSTQIKIVQTGSKATTSPYGDGGYSFDDLHLYVAGRDVSVVDAFIKKVNCSKTFTPLPLTIKVRNNAAQPVTNLPVYYQVNNEAPVTEVIAGPINTTDTFTYTFNTLFNHSSPGLYNIKVWAQNTGDNYKINDTLQGITVIVMKTIDSFPYYNDFETDNGNMFSEGINNSWVWGTPAKYNMNDAAQDNKAWTTGISKGYHFNENSYLYMGCMDFSALTTDPLISFNFISVMQTQSDSAYAEYSTDGLSWNRLGCYNCGLNWYNGYGNKPYWDQIIFPWQVAHTKVLRDSLQDKSNFMYRIHLLTDDYIITEGLGIDDLHILKDVEEMATSDSTYISSVSTGNGWIKFYRNDKLVAELYDDHKNLGNVTLGFESNDTKHKEFDN
ncbi:MAG: hypothetical protein JWN78_1485, partial [Bacteroidota bacterium]|nr:hypothetical protein [Bacteroidota bacterium]